MLISTNGAAWTDVNESKVFGSGGLGPVSGGGSGFAGLGFARNKQFLWTSEDGLTWQRRALPSELTEPNASVADPASIDGALVVPGVRLLSGIPDESASGYPPGAGVHNCGASTTGPPPPVYAPALYASSDEGSHWTAVSLPGAVKAAYVSLSLLRVDDHTLIAIEWYQQGGAGAGPNWVYWVSSDGSTWRRAPSATWDAILYLTPLSAHAGGLLYSTQALGTADYYINVLSMYAVSGDGQPVTLDQTGDIPVVPVDPGTQAELAIGPAGVLFGDGGSNMWLGIRR